MRLKSSALQVVSRRRAVCFHFRSICSRLLFPLMNILRLIYYIDSSSNVHEKILNFTHDSDTFQKMVKSCFFRRFYAVYLHSFLFAFLPFLYLRSSCPCEQKSTSRPGLHSGRDVRIEDSIAAVASAFLGLGEAVKPHFGSFYIVCILPFVCARLRLHIPFNLRLSLQHRVNHGRQLNLHQLGGAVQALAHAPWCCGTRGTSEWQPGRLPCRKEHRAASGPPAWC